MKIKETLYKLDSKGKVREWSIYVENDGTSFYSVRHGERGGALQETRVDILQGKNLGKVNETSADEQCMTEALAMHTKQIERKGYSVNIPEEVPFRPMLAHVYKDHKHKIVWPAAISPKYDGIRVLIQVKDKEVTLTSRTGKQFYGLDHLVEDFSNLDDIVIDGELYSNSLTFQEITSVVRKSKSVDPRAKQVFVTGFDIINDDIYHNRVLLLENVASKTTYLIPATWYLVKDENDVERRHVEFVQGGFEGSMIRNLRSPYQLNKRSYHLLKKKDFVDGEFEIIGYKTGVGKFAGVPIFLLKTGEASFEAVPKGTEEDRLEYLNRADSLIGKMATIKYFELTDDGIPRFPVLIGVRDYE